PHLFRGYIAKIERVPGNAFAIPQGIEEGFVLDDRTPTADIKGVVNDFCLLLLEKVAGGQSRVPVIIGAFSVVIVRAALSNCVEIAHSRVLSRVVYVDGLEFLYGLHVYGLAVESLLFD